MVTLTGNVEQEMKQEEWMDSFLNRDLDDSGMSCIVYETLDRIQCYAGAVQDYDKDLDCYMDGLRRNMKRLEKWWERYRKMAAEDITNSQPVVNN